MRLFSVFYLIYHRLIPHRFALPIQQCCTTYLDRSLYIRSKHYGQLPLSHSGHHGYVLSGAISGQEVCFHDAVCDFGYRCVDDICTPIGHHRDLLETIAELEGRKLRELADENLKELPAGSEIAISDDHANCWIRILGYHHGEWMNATFSEDDIGSLKVVLDDLASEVAGEWAQHRESTETFGQSHIWFKGTKEQISPKAMRANERRENAQRSTREEDLRQMPEGTILAIESSFQLYSRDANYWIREPEEEGKRRKKR